MFRSVRNCVYTVDEMQSLLTGDSYKKYGCENLDPLASEDRCCGNEKCVRINLRAPSDETTPNSLEDNVFSSKMNLSTKGELKQLLHLKDYFNYFKISVLVVIWIVCCFMMMTKGVKIKNVHQLSVSEGLVKGYLVSEAPKQGAVLLTLEGAFLPDYYANLSNKWMSVWIQIVIAVEKTHNLTSLHSKNILATKNVSEYRKIPLVSEKLIGVVPEISKEEHFKLEPISCDYQRHCYLKINLNTNLKSNFPVSLMYDVDPIDTHVGVIYAAGILVFLYVLIIFEIVHKTLASIMASTISIAVLAALNARPTTAELISWIDIETLLLLFSMMTLVAIFGETGIFDYLAVFAYKIARGRVWTLVNTLCFFTAVLSCFLDNVTTALLMTPVTIRLCEMVRINPVPVLISMILYSNVGGAITPIGDPPNVIIASNSAVVKSGVNFSTFTMHMGVGVAFCLVVVYIQLRLLYKTEDLRFDEPNDVQDLKREIEVWKRAAASMGSYSKEETIVKKSLMKRTTSLLGRLNDKTNCLTNSCSEGTLNIQDLEEQYHIRDKSLLIKSSITMTFVILAFFLHSVPEIENLGLAWTAFLGALLLLILSGREDIDAIVGKVEWGTLLFFASLFILMEALSRLGLIDWIGNQTHNIIMSVGQESRLAVAILLILWVSAAASAFVDNIPLTTMMIRIATGLADNPELGLPLQPLIWALSFGACLGGNGTLFGSSSNIVCAGVAEQHGYKLSFTHFMKIGTPIMLSTTCVITIYLLVAHVVWTWH